MKKIYLPLIWLGTLSGWHVACTNSTADNIRDVQPGLHQYRLSAQPSSPLISVEEAKKMVANYGAKAGTVNQSGQEISDTRMAWISLDYLESILATLKAGGGSGLRIYLAAYDDKYAESNTAAHVPPQDWWGHTTLLFVPTRDTLADGTTYQQDYFDWTHVPDTPPADSSGTQVGVLNRAGICPPPKPCKFSRLLDEE